MNWKVCGRNRSWLNLNSYPDSYLEGLKKKRGQPQSVFLVSGRNSNQTLSEYKSGALWLRHRARLILVLISLTGFPLILTNHMEQVLLEKLMVALMVKKFRPLYETRSSLPCSQEPTSRCIQSTPYHIFPRSILILSFRSRLGLLRGRRIGGSREVSIVTRMWGGT
jgi:hypothetical protein